MRELLPPPVPYDATAQRPDWNELPAEVRAAIEARLGAPVTGARPTRGGFTRGFAAVLSTESGEPAFVKASSIDYLIESYQGEAALTAALPAAVPAPRPRWTASAAGWYILCLDAIVGHVPRLPWDPGELRAALTAWATAADALRRNPPELPGLTSFATDVREEFVAWQEIAAHRAPLPAMPRYALAHLDELAALEASLLPLASDAPGGTLGFMHRDLRLDNVIIGEDGTAWLCDWNWLCHGPAWFDTLSLLITAYASGLDADGLFAGHPTAEAAPAGALDAGLAALAGFYLSHASRPSDASPSLKPHRQWTGEVALAWLADRRGWSTASGVLAGSERTW